MVGPAESKLVSTGKIKGLVLGAFGEASEGLHDLADQLAESRVAVQVPNREKSTGKFRFQKAEKGVVVGQIRRVLSVSILKANARHRIDSVWQVGPEGRAASARRQKAEAAGRSLERGFRRQLAAERGRRSHFGALGGGR